jgi:hypothetical protein
MYDGKKYKQFLNVEKKWYQIPTRQIFVANLGLLKSLKKKKDTKYAF